MEQRHTSLNESNPEETDSEETDSEREFRLTDAGNTHNSAFVVIRSKGYQIYYYPDADEDRPGDYWAIKGKRDFISSDPVALLGLIAIWEHFGDEWYKVPKPKITAEVWEIAFPEGEYEELDDEAFSALVEHLRPFFQAIFRPLPENITRPELAAWMNTYYESDPDAA